VKFFEKQIGNHFYKAGAFPARKALSLKLKLAGLLGPALSSIKINDVGGADSLNGLTSSDGVSISGDEMKVIAVIASAIGGALANINEKQFMGIVDEMIELVEVKENDTLGYSKLSASFDTIYMCDLGELYLVLAEVFVLNFPFLVKGLSNLRGITSRLQGKTTTSH